MLSHSKGFLALNQKYDMPFDATQIDIIANAELPETRGISKLNEKLLNCISQVLEEINFFWSNRKNKNKELF